MTGFALITLALEAGIWCSDNLSMVICIAGESVHAQWPAHCHCRY